MFLKCLAPYHPLLEKKASDHADLAADGTCFLSMIRNILYIETRGISTVSLTKENYHGKTKFQNNHTGEPMFNCCTCTSNSRKKRTYYLSSPSISLADNLRLLPYYLLHCSAARYHLKLESIRALKQRLEMTLL